MAGTVGVALDSYVAPNERPVLYAIEDHGCILSRTCLACPLSVCKEDVGTKRAILTSFPANDWPQRYDRFIPKETILDRSCSTLRR